MNRDERALLFSVARWVAQQEEWEAANCGTKSKLAEEMRRLIESVRPKVLSCSDRSFVALG